MNRLIAVSCFSERQIAKKEANERNNLFENLYIQLCELGYGKMDIIQWSKKRLSEVSYITMYDSIVKKRKAIVLQANADI